MKHIKTKPNEKSELSSITSLKLEIGVPDLAVELEKLTKSGKPFCFATAFKPEENAIAVVMSPNTFEAIWTLINGIVLNRQWPENFLDIAIKKSHRNGCIDDKPLLWAFELLMRTFGFSNNFSSEDESIETELKELGVIHDQ